jgi:hypothetical protein
VFWDKFLNNKKAFLMLEYLEYLYSFEFFVNNILDFLTVRVTVHDFLSLKTTFLDIFLKKFEPFSSLES